MEKRTYNGWTNYETWNVKLWIDNDEGLAEDVRQICMDAADEYTASKDLQAFIEEMNPIGGDAGMFADLLNAALSEVNWYEIAEAIRDDNKDEDEEEAEEKE